MRRHFTATAFVIDPQGRTLLLWHKRLRRWMPPGGHVDPDERPDEAARRECKEETGLDVEIIGDAQPDLFAGAAHEGSMIPRPFAMLLEEIPACPERDEEAHQHMDFLYLARPIAPDQTLLLAEQEGDELRWFSAEDIAALADGDIFANVRHYITHFLRPHSGFISPSSPRAS